MSRIGFIGTGHIAAPMVRFLANRGHDIAVTRRNEQISADLARTCGARVAEAADVLAQSEIIFLCLRPHTAQDVLKALDFRPDHRIISVMAGIAEAALRDICAPATRLVQTIPLGFLEQGGCPLAAYGDHTMLADLFEPDNPVVPVASESALNAHFAICAMVPGLLDLMNTGADWLGEMSGDAPGAAFYTTQLVSGFLAAQDRTVDMLARERDALATEGTLSLQMVEALRTGGATDVMRDALSAIETRLNGNDD